MKQYLIRSCCGGKPDPRRALPRIILQPGIAALVTLGVAADAATVTSTWKTATSGIWNVDANWNNAPAQGGFPNDGNLGIATYDAVISAAGADYTVTLNTTNTVEHLTLNSANATLTVTAGTLTANTGMDLTAGSLLLNGGAISNSAVNAAAGTLNFGASSNNVLSVTVWSAPAAAITLVSGNAKLPSFLKPSFQFILAVNSSSCFSRSSRGVGEGDGDSCRPGASRGPIVPRSAWNSIFAVTAI